MNYNDMIQEKCCPDDKIKPQHRYSIGFFMDPYTKSTCKHISDFSPHEM